MVEEGTGRNSSICTIGTTKFEQNYHTTRGTVAKNFPWVYRTDKSTNGSSEGIPFVFLSCTITNIL
jgi:hypothetical protein